MQVAAIEKSVDDFLNVRPPKTKFRRKLIVVDPDEFFEIILDTAIPSGGFRIARTVNFWSIVHDHHSIGEQKANGKQKRFFDWIFVSIMDKRLFEIARPKRFGEEIEGRDIAHGGRFLHCRWSLFMIDGCGR